MTIDEMIAVLQAAKEGKTIEVRQKTNVVNAEWSTDCWHLFNFATMDYRVKPEPIERWAVVVDTLPERIRFLCQSQIEAESYQKGLQSSQVVHLREVID